MKKIIYLITIIVSALCVSCAENDIDKPQWPEWPSRPVIENAQLRGLNNETTVAAGRKVKFTAHISDEYTDLASYKLEFKSGGVTIASETGVISGSSADISFETVFPFGSYYQDGGYPEVTISATNVSGFSSELQLANADNVSVTRPVTPDHLYLVDNKGANYTFDRVGNTFAFKTFGNLSSLGTSFKIAEKLNGTQIDYSGLVWGIVDGNLVVVDNASANSISTPETGIYNIKSLRFDMYSFDLSKTIDLLVEIKKSDMTIGNGDYLVMENLTMVQDCEVQFTGFDKDLSKMLRPDLFVNISDNTAKFAGNTRNWRAFYNQSTKFMYVQTYNNEENLLWLTGTGGGFPLPPYAATLDWFGTEPHGYFSFIRTGDDIFEMLVYLAPGFVIKVYRKVSWATEITTWTSTTPNLLSIASNGDGMPGPEFTPGVYTLRVDATKEEGALIPYE